MSNGMDSAATVIFPNGTTNLTARLGVTRAHFLKAAFWSAVIVFIFWCAYKIERDVLNRHPADIRYIRDASEAAMRYITIPHIIIGFLFMVSSRNNQNTRQRLWVLGLLLAGTGLCTLYYGGGGRTDFILSAGVYFYFVVHELRDEAMFYTVLGEAAPIANKSVFKSFVRWMVALIVGSMVAITLMLAPFGIFLKKLTASETGLASLGLAQTAWFDGSLPTPWKIAAAAAPVVLISLGYAYVLRRYARLLGYPDVRTFMETHHILFFVMFGVAAVLGLTILITQRFYGLILFHVVAWYIFASYQFAKHPPKTPPQGWWAWMRSTGAGFKTLHIGMVVILMALGLYWTLGMDQSPVLHWLLAPESFLYWTIMHITVSFVPR